MTIQALSLLVPILVAAPAWSAAGGTESGAAAPDLGSLLSTWRAEHGDDWRAQVDPATGHLEMLFGGHAAPRFAPRDDADFAVLARQALADTYAMHGLEDATLEFERLTFLPLGMIGSSDKMTARFRQEVAGTPVEGGYANVLFDMDGRLLSIQVTGLPHAARSATSAAIEGPRAVRRAVEWFVAQHGLAPTRAGEPELVLDRPLDDEGRRAARLAWKVDVQHASEGTSPVGKLTFVDAATGAVYRSEESVHFFDVSGTVSSMATPGNRPDVAGNAPTSQLMRFLRVTSGATTTFTDTNGNFTLSGVNAPASVTFQYANGTYANVQNSAGAEYALTTTLNSATGNAVLMNSPAAATITAQANCSRVIPLLRDFVKALNPADTHADLLVRANTAVSGSCNAYFDGASINFYNAAGSCVNSAYSTVISHELGHWMNVLYGTGNGSDGMGEGNADVWAMYVHDTPIVGEDFQGTSDIRTGLNNTQFCGDSNPACYGEVHADGEPWMGAAWKVRNRLNTALGNAPGDLVANTLFLAWMNGYNQTAIRSIIETQWVTLDDDDGNINNGTPHFTHIDLGFRDQGFPGLTLYALSFSAVTDLPDTADQIGPYTVNATIQANQLPPTTSATLHYRIDGGAFAPIAMSFVSGNSWTVQIPGIAAPAHVEYYLSATDSGAGSGTFPLTAPNLLLEFDVGIVHVLRFHNFDSASDEGWTHGTVGDTSSTADDWQHETPAGKTGTGWADPNGAFSPSGAWGTDMGNGTTSSTVNGAYAANAHMWLRTPITNCSGATSVRLRFKRWLSIQGSASDQARILVNGTQIYINPATNLNDGQWVTQEFVLGGLADNNPSVQVEWRLRSNGTTNWGGWNIDDVKLLWIEVPVPACATPQNYCSTSPNSVGPGAVMGWQGTPNISTNNFELLAVGCPPNAAGLFFYGANATQTVFGNGFRCVGGSVFRLPLTTTDFLGDGHTLLDYNNLPQPIQAGEQWRFQFWYRNPAAGGAGFNLTDGLLVTFCP